ncbi:hypothetical protein JW992_08375, partial [candidate division KSB1 bacterium]|nr:hypothetical protein [candidate division KSB1 bacterium]
MSRIFFILSVFSLFGVYDLPAAIDVRVVPQAFWYDTPHPGTHTAFVDIQARADSETEIPLAAFQLGLQMSDNFRDALVDLGFLESRFSDSDYCLTRDWDGETGAVRLIATLKSESPAAIGSEWVSLQRLEATTLLAETDYSLTYADGEPRFYAADTNLQEVTGHAESIPLFAERIPVVFSFPAAGWYLVSLPGTTADTDAASLFPGIPPDKIKSYDPSRGGYVAATDLQAGTGYWFFITSPGDYTLELTPLHAYEKDFSQPGWYAIGSVWQEQEFVQPTVRPEESVLLPLMEYDPQHYVTQPAFVLRPTRGYWLAVTQPCRMTTQPDIVQLAKTASAEQARIFARDFAAQPPEVPHFDSEAPIVSIPARFQLYQNYPNPFNPSTLIRFDLAESRYTRLAIYNTRGQKVRT